MSDPWKHRGENMRCKTCMWFVPKAAVPVHPNVHDPLGARQPDEIGRCRRHAPTMNGYPVVFNRDWCGDHKLDENKLVP